VRCSAEVEQIRPPTLRLPLIRQHLLKLAQPVLRHHSPQVLLVFGRFENFGSRLRALI